MIKGNHLQQLCWNKTRFTLWDCSPSSALTRTLEAEREVWCSSVTCVLLTTGLCPGGRSRSTLPVKLTPHAHTLISTGARVWPLTSSRHCSEHRPGLRTEDIQTHLDTQWRTALPPMSSVRSRTICSSICGPYSPIKSIRISTFCLIWLKTTNNRTTVCLKTF